MARGRKLVRRVERPQPPRPPTTTPQPGWTAVAHHQHRDEQTGVAEDGVVRHVAMDEAVRTKFAAEKGIPAHKVKLKTVEGSCYKLRAHTHEKGCIRFSDSKLEWPQWNKDVYEPWLASSYADHVRPWFMGKPPSTFVKFVHGEFGRSSVDQVAQVARWHMEDLRRTLDMVNEEDNFWLKWEYHLNQKQREMAILRTLKRPVDAAEKFDVGYSRDDCPELTLERMSTGSNFQDLCLGLIPPPGSTAHWCNVRSPGGVWERLQDPETAPGSSGGIGITEGMRVWAEDGWTRRHAALIIFCLGVIETCLGRPEEDMAITGVLQVPKMSASTRETYTTPIGGQPVAPPPRRPDAIKCCVKCGQFENETKKHTCCQRCKEKVNRSVYYCSRECQVADWKAQHKEICGRPLADTMQLGKREEKRIDPKTALLEKLKKFPRAIMIYDNGNDRATLETTDIHFNLPTFIRPFRETLASLTDIRDKAFEERDSVAIGVVSMFMRLSSPYSKADEEGLAASRALLCRVLKLESAELDPMEKEAEKELQGEQLSLILSCFEQLKTGKPDATLPDLTIPESALLVFDTLERFPFAWYAADPTATLPSEKRATLPRQSIPVDLPPFFQFHKETLTALRALTYRVLEGQGQNRLDIGLLLAAWTLFNHATMSHKYDDYEPVEANEACTAMIAAAFGFDKSELPRMQWEAWSHVEASLLWDNDDYAPVLNMLAQCDEEAAFPWPRDPPPGVGKKKRNKKKKKAKKGGEAGVEAEAPSVVSVGKLEELEEAE